ncbi:single-stranded-DNA-specific exonuclease RecJ [Halothiobacillus sp. DCM-1]|uniref:single-stranded-DNA-specific exonuclease RecJ n=1 Tax=Halothiobacillus sp. DCM-1 TaxID=3112558 RepID=UPI00324D2E22
MAHLSPVLSAVLLNRGITDPSALDCSLARLLPHHDLPGIEAAAACLAAAIMRGDSILIVGDFDADGATATALCLRALRAFGAARVEFTLPDRQRHGYGLSAAVLADWLAEGNAPPGLILTVDNGIAAFDGVRAAKALGATVVITDHHLPGETLPAADAIVNPNLVGSTFASSALAGVGVAFYVLAAVREALTAAGWFQQRPRPNLAQWLDLVAVGTVADVVPLDDNNRRLVAQGLARIRAMQASPGVLALFAVAGKDPRLARSGDLGFVVGPRLNAAGRLEHMRQGVECLLCDDPARAHQLARALDEVNQARRAIEQDMLERLPIPATGMAERPTNPQDWVVFDPSFHHGVIGIVAGRLKDRWQRPVFVFAPENAEEPQGWLKASGRSIGGVHLRDVLVEMATRAPGLIAQFGGHAMAAGLRLRHDQLAAFRAEFAAVLAPKLAGFPESATVWSDGALPAEAFSLAFAESLVDALPWGADCPEPVFDGVFEVLNTTPLKDGAHLKLTVQPLFPVGQGSASRGVGGVSALPAIWFGVGADAPPGNYWRIAYRLNLNHFRGQTQLQLVVVTAQPA